MPHKYRIAYSASHTPMKYETKWELDDLPGTRDLAGQYETQVTSNTEAITIKKLTLAGAASTMDLNADNKIIGFYMFPIEKPAAAGAGSLYTRNAAGNIGVICNWGKPTFIPMNNSVELILTNGTGTTIEIPYIRFKIA